MVGRSRLNPRPATQITEHSSTFLLNRNHIRKHQHDHSMCFVAITRWACVQQSVTEQEQTILSVLPVRAQLGDVALSNKVSALGHNVLSPKGED